MSPQPLLVLSIYILDFLMRILVMIIHISQSLPLYWFIISYHPKTASYQDLCLMDLLSPFPAGHSLQLHKWSKVGTYGILLRIHGARVGNDWLFFLRAVVYLPPEAELQDVQSGLETWVCHHDWQPHVRCSATRTTALISVIVETNHASLRVRNLVTKIVVRELESSLQKEQGSDIKVLLDC
jgi:hypothetical protein